MQALRRLLLVVIAALALASSAAVPAHASGHPVPITRAEAILSSGADPRGLAAPRPTEAAATAAGHDTIAAATPVRVAAMPVDLASASASPVSLDLTFTDGHRRWPVQCRWSDMASRAGLTDDGRPTPLGVIAAATAAMFLIGSGRRAIAGVARPR